MIKNIRDCSHIMCQSLEPNAEDYRNNTWFLISYGYRQEASLHIKQHAVYCLGECWPLWSSICHLIFMARVRSDLWPGKWQSLICLRCQHNFLHAHFLTWGKASKSKLHFLPGTDSIPLWSSLTSEWNKRGVLSYLSLGRGWRLEHMPMHCRSSQGRLRTLSLRTCLNQIIYVLGWTYNPI